MLSHRSPANLAVVFGLRELLACSCCRGLSLDRHVDLDLLGLGFLALRNGEGQDAVFVLGLDGLGTHGVREREAAAEAAVGALDAQVVVFVHLLLELALAANREDVVLDADVEVLGLHVGKVGLDDEFLTGLIDVDRRGPTRQIGLTRAVKSFVKEAIDLVLKGRDAAKGLETANCGSHSDILHSDIESIIKYERLTVKYYLLGRRSHISIFIYRAYWPVRVLEKVATARGWPAFDPAHGPVLL